MAHPKAAKYRHDQRVREAASRMFIESYPDDYAELMAASKGNGTSWDARRREALKAMRRAHPDEWRTVLARARKDLSE